MDRFSSVYRGTMPVHIVKWMGEGGPVWVNNDLLPSTAGQTMLVSIRLDACCVSDAYVMFCSIASVHDLDWLTHDTI